MLNSRGFWILKLIPPVLQDWQTKPLLSLGNLVPGSSLPLLNLGKLPGLEVRET